jgi:hypothetical protein
VELFAMEPMPTNITKTSRAVVAATAFLAGAMMAADAAAEEVIQLTQTGCQFLEPEGGDHQFKTSKAADCNAINAASGAGRLATANVLELKPGKYVFRVTNKNVPYELGFWLRDEDYNWKNPLHKLTKISVSGGGIDPGETQEYEVELKPGTYLYSCPLNPTPDYKLVVSDG